MSSKSKITLSNTISDSELKSFDELVDDSLDETIGYTSKSEEIDSNGYDYVEKSSIIEENNDIYNRKNKICPFADKSMNSYEDVNQKMIDIFNDFVSDTKLTIANLSSVAQNEAFIKARWCSKAIAAKLYAKQLQDEYEELKSKVTEMVTLKSKTNGAFLTKSRNIERYVENDANVKALAKKVYEAKLLEELYKEYYNDIIKGLGFQIRNSIDTLNFERGL